MSFIWSAVAVNPRGEIIRARSFPGEVVVTNETTGAEWRQAVPTDFLRYLKVAATETKACAIGVGEGDLAYLVLQGQAVFYTKVHGQDAVGIEALPNQTFVPYAVLSGLEWMRGWERRPIPEHITARGFTSQGFRQVRPFVIFGDDALGGVYGGHSIWRPVDRDGWVVGQRQDGIGAFQHSTGKYFVALSGVAAAEGIDFAVTPAGALAIVAAIKPGGEFFRVFLPPYPDAEPKPDDHTPDDEKDPPTDEPKEPPVSIPSQIDLVKRIRAKYPRHSPGSHPLGEDAWRCIVEIAQATDTLVFRKDSGENCRIPAGLLAKYPDGVSINRTIIGRGAFGNQWVKVLGDGEGTAFPIWTNGDTPANGEYVDVSAIELDGAEPKEDPDPDPDPKPGDLEQRVAALEKRQTRVEAWIRRAL